MRIIDASKFKVRCRRLIDEVARTRTPVLIMKRGKPVAKLVPHDSPEATNPLGVWRGLVTITGDIVSSIDARWNACLPLTIKRHDARR